MITLAILHTVIALCAVAALALIVVALCDLERTYRVKPIRRNRRTGPGCVPADLFQATLDRLARESDGLPARNGNQCALIHATAAASMAEELESRRCATDWRAVIRNPIMRTRPRARS